jgi:anti-sigma regulatory factor (Ser/Thr protein kinase)
VEFEMARFLQRIRQKRREKQENDKKQARQAQTIAVPTPLLETSTQTLTTDTDGWQPLQVYQIPSAMGNERLAMSYVVETVKPFHLPERRVNQLGTAVAEATMNAMEHGNHYNPEIPVMLQIFSSDQAIAVRISDQGGTSSRPASEEYEVPDYEAPDIEAKLAELQSPRGWGLFLIQNMVDEMHVHSDEDTHTIELILHLDGDSNAHEHA